MLKNKLDSSFYKKNAAQEFFTKSLYIFVKSQKKIMLTLFLIEQKEIVLDKEYFGVVITPLDTHLMSAIIGLYFGGSLVKK